MVAGLLLAMWAACGDVSYAEPRHLPARTICTKPGAVVSIELPAERWLVSRDQLDKANAAAAVRAKIERQLVDVSRRARRARRAARGRTAASLRSRVWTGIGTAVGAAFVAGLLLR